MARMILHTGMSKAGSTALQQFLVENQSLLLTRGVTYFDLVRGPNHGQLAVAFSDQTGRVARIFGVRHEQDRDRMRVRLRKRIAKNVSPDSTWIASSEHIGSQLRRPPEIAALASFLGEFFDQITVVRVVRRADYWLPSSYVENVKAGGVQPFDGRFVHWRRRQLNHRRHLWMWRKAFGQNNLVSVPFLESDTRSLSALPQRVLEAVGLADVASQPWRFPADLANKSISAQATELLRHLNPSLDEHRLFPTRVRKQAIALLAQEWPGPRTVLTPSAAEALSAGGWTQAGALRPADVQGPGWTAWEQQEPAPVQPSAEVSPGDLESATALLERHGVIRRNGRTALRADMNAVVRDALIRVARR